jgi:glycosyltransferase involved in cell wall biosynthesis
VLRTEVPITASVIIATRNRPEPLRECLQSVRAQTRAPEEVIVADGSEDSRTETLCAQFKSAGFAALRYVRCAVRGAAAQRNEAARSVQGDVICFFDDDCVLEPGYIAATMGIFLDDADGTIASVVGTITGQDAHQPSLATRAFWALMAGTRYQDWTGRVFGPAINLWPRDDGKRMQPVDWAPSGVVAYRRSVFREFNGFPAFEGYSYGEDLHLSLRVAKRYRIVHTSLSRLAHRNLGANQADWARIGRMQVVNRWVIMRDVMGSGNFSGLLKLLALQGFGILAAAREVGRNRRIGRHWKETQGRLSGLSAVFRDWWQRSRVTKAGRLEDENQTLL